MFKTRLQEYCQAQKLNLPEYSTTKEGLDHCPLFKASVIVNGLSFTTPDFSKSTKEAKNLAAQIAFHHLTGSSTANTVVQVSPTLVDAQQPKANDPVVLQAASLSTVITSNKDHKKHTGMVHLYKQELQSYAQKRNLNLPVYMVEREGPPHASRFRCKVMLEGKTFESLEYFGTIKDAENAAAKAALKYFGTEEEDPALCKSLLQALTLREYSCLPSYVTRQSGPPHNPIFSSIVELNEYSFTGQEAKSKRLAEMNAAKVAYIALRERKGKQGTGSDSPGYHVNDAPRCSSPKLELLPEEELTDGSNSAPNPLSNRVSVEVSCNKDAHHQDSKAKDTLSKLESGTNFNQKICEEKTNALPSGQDLSCSSTTFVCPRQPAIGDNSEPAASSPRKRIKVYPLTSGMTLPVGATIMHKDEGWVAVTSVD